MNADLIQEAVDRVEQLLHNYDSYDTEMPAEILADIIHYCKVKGFDFADQLNIAESYVAEERSMMEAVYDRA